MRSAQSPIRSYLLALLAYASMIFFTASHVSGNLGKLFGSEFAQTLAGLESHEWHGPVLSGYGVHLVYVHDRVVAPAPSYADVRATVRQDWREHQRAVLNDKFLEGLLARYEVVIEETPTE